MTMKSKKAVPAPEFVYAPKEFTVAVMFEGSEFSDLQERLARWFRERMAREVEDLLRHGG